MDRLWWTAIIGVAIGNAVLFTSAYMTEQLPQPFARWELRAQISN